MGFALVLLLFGRMVAGFFDVDQLHCGGDVDDVLRRGLLDRFVDGGLEALEVDHGVGAGEGVEGGGGEFEVVRFGPVGGEGFDCDPVAADLLGEVLQGVEGGLDRECGLRGGLGGFGRGVRVVARRARGQRGHEGEGAGGDDGTRDLHGFSLVLLGIVVKRV